MSDFITSLFEGPLNVSDPRELQLPLEQEIEAIADAQSGDEAAVIDLLGAYRPALRTAVKRFAANSALPVEDIRAEAVAAFYQAVSEHDPAGYPRLGGAMTATLTRRLADATGSTASGFTVPERTLSRFFSIFRKADGDADLALEIAQQHGMRRETFLAVLAAVNTDSLEGTMEYADSEHVPAKGRDLAASPVFAPVEIDEDRILVEVAFTAVDDTEARICELSYGFTEGDPLPDAEVAYRVQSTRPTIQRKRRLALGKMREALGVSLTEEAA